ncbi:MAG: hypothetical protein J5449_06730 [Oscillospiraceae bacterium]|nr:hypothetical protein [Oscillospiraceae bacterium]
MEIGNVKVGGSNVYKASEKVNVKAEGKENENAKAEVVSTDAEAASYKADGGRSYSASASRGAYAVDADTIERMRDESEQRMMNLVKKMLGQQVEQADMAGMISKEKVLEAIKSGKFTQEDVDQAKKDTADDGYWGVEQTSDRFIQYATALTGGDPEKLDSMIEAFEKGYAEAEKMWGGKLPDLAQRTREATLKKFQDLKDQYANNSVSAAAGQSVLQSGVQKAMDSAD